MPKLPHVAQAQQTPSPCTSSAWNLRFTIGDSAGGRAMEDEAQMVHRDWQVCRRV